MKILSKLNLARQIIKWLIELSKYELCYELRDLITHLEMHNYIFSNKDIVNPHVRLNSYFLLSTWLSSSLFTREHEWLSPFLFYFHSLK